MSAYPDRVYVFDDGPEGLRADIEPWLDEEEYVKYIRADIAEQRIIELEKRIKQLEWTLAVIGKACKDRLAQQESSDE